MIAREQREVLRDIVGHGLTSGLGDPTPGSMCVEAAVCLAFGEPHGDRPTCVAGPDRSFAVEINDAFWSSHAARAEALLPLALAQLGTAGTYRTAWVLRVADGTIRRVLPLALRAFAAESPHREALLAAADRCEQEGSAVAAVDAVRNVGADVIGTGSSCIYDALCAAGAAYDAHYAAAPRAAYAALAATAAARGVICRHGDADQVLRVAVDVALDAYRAERGAVDDAGEGSAMSAEYGEEGGVAMSSEQATCAACGAPADGNHSICRDGPFTGPEVELCDACGAGPTPTLDELHAAIRVRAAMPPLSRTPLPESNDIIFMCSNCGEERDEPHAWRACAEGLAKEHGRLSTLVWERERERDKALALLNTPETIDFAEAVRREAAHQRARWGTEADAGKAPSDWFWLVGYLAGKALHAHVEGRADKALHHTISSAAALANWHAAILGNTDMRPGIERAEGDDS